MQMNIKNPEACRLAQQLAAATGKSLTAVVTDALAAELARVEKLNSIADRRARVDALVDAINADLPRPLPTMADIDSWLYDENGLPR
jgi:antitoxin VapB